MKVRIHLLFSILFGIGIYIPAYGGDPIHTVWDIDGTIAIDIREAHSSAEKKAYLADTKNLITVTLPTGDLITYYVYPGVREAMAYLIGQGIKISFFSEGTELRNRTLLENILLPNGTSLAQNSTFIFSKQHLGVGDEITAWERKMMLLRPEVREEFAPPRKDLWLADKDLSNVVLFDNGRFTILPSQIANWIQVSDLRIDRILTAMAIFEEAREIATKTSRTMRETLPIVKAEYSRLEQEQIRLRANTSISPRLSCLAQIIDSGL